MTLYNKINTWLSHNDYVPDSLYGDNKSCVIKYNMSNSEGRGMYCKLRYSINRKPYAWGNADIKFALNLHDPSMVITITPNSKRSI